MKYIKQGIFVATTVLIFLGISIEFGLWLKSRGPTWKSTYTVSTGNPAYTLFGYKGTMVNYQVNGHSYSAAVVNPESDKPMAVGTEDACWVSNSGQLYDDCGSWWPHKQYPKLYMIFINIFGSLLIVAIGVNRIMFRETKHKQQELTNSKAQEIYISAVRDFAKLDPELAFLKGS